jgi:pyruvate kinase
MIQIRGREVRISPFAKNEATIRIRTSNTVKLIGGAYGLPSDVEGNNVNLRVSCDSMQRNMKPNDVVYIDDGKVVGIVQEVTENGVKLEVKETGIIKSHCAIRYTGGKHSTLPAVSLADIEDLKAISELIMIDFVVLPFVSSSADVKKLQEDLISLEGSKPSILSRIDTIDGIHNFDEILEKSAGIIFMRKELGIEMQQTEKLMLAQKWVIE